MARKKGSTSSSSDSSDSDVDLVFDKKTFVENVGKLLLKSPILDALTEKKEKEIKALKKKNKSMKKELESLKEKFEKADKDLKSANKKLKTAEKNTEASSKKHETTQKELKAAQEKVESLKLEKVIKSLKFEKDLKTATNKLNTAEAIVEITTEKHEATRKELKTTQENLKSKNSSLSMSKMRESCLEESEKQLKKEVKTLKKKLASAENLRDDLCKRAEVAQGLTRWQYKSDEDEWTDMASSVSQELDEQYERCLNGASPRSYKMKVSDKMYEFDFEAMTQKNTRSGCTREIRLFIDHPAHWERVICAENRLSRDLDDIMQEIDADDAILKGLRATHCGSKIGKCSDYALVPPREALTTLYQVENLPRWHAYVNERTRIRSSHASHDIELNAIDPAIPQELASTLFENIPGLPELDKSVNEVFVFHGTSEEVMKKIIIGGFDPRTAADKGMYGAGIYFASNICKSHQYTDYYNNEYKKGYIIISRVTLGNIEYVDHSIHLNHRAKKRRPKELEDGCTYDSTVAKPQIMKVRDHNGNELEKCEQKPNRRQFHQEFIIFSDSQAYPELVLEYEYFDP